MKADRPTIFVSYSHQDKRWKERIVKQLRALEKDGQLRVWEDTQIHAGQYWEAKITDALSDCNVALLLISADFLTSNFIQTTEVPALLKRRIEEGIRLIPVIVSDCPWKEISWLRGILARPEGGTPLDGLSRAKANTALAQLANEILNLPPAPPLPPLPPGPGPGPQPPPAILPAAPVNEPRLVIEWLNTTGPFIIPAPRDKLADANARLLTELARGGIPDDPWLDAALVPTESRRAKARAVPESLADDDGLSPRSAAEGYAKDLKEWYRLARLRLVNEHETATNQARSIYLVFTVFNRGRAPAQNVTVELSFPLGLRLDWLCPEGMHWPYRTAPEAPRSIARKLESGFPKRTIPLAPWYEGPPYEKPKAAHAAVQLLRLTEEDRPKQTWRARFNLLEHGSSRALEPLCVCFGYQPASDFQIEYRLHASNQPEDSLGTLLAQVREIQLAPGCDSPP